MKSASKYDLTTREGRQHFYHSDEWRSLREFILSRKPLCVFCLDKDMIRVATVCDHIVDIAVDPALRLDPSNIQPLCTKCHNEKTARRSSVNYEVNQQLFNKKWNLKPLNIPKKS